MSVDKSDIIQCACGQRMRLPAGSQGRVFKCVACGALIERGGEQVGAGTGSAADPPTTSNMTAGSEQLLALFVGMGLITKEQQQIVQSEYRPDEEKIFETLLRLEIVSKEELHACLSREPGTATINLTHFSIDSRLTELLPVRLVMKHWALPIDKLGRSLTAAMVCPIDMEAIAAIEERTGLRVRPMLCTLDDFLSSTRKHYQLADETDDDGTVANPTLLRREGVESAPAPSGSAAPSARVSAGNKKMREAIAQLEALSIPARVLTQVDAVVGVESEGLRQVVAVVGGSPPFAANVLCTANSAAYGLSGAIDSIPMAIALIGEQAVAVLAANAPTVPSSNERQWFHLTRYSRHCAEIASVLAADCGRVVPNVAYCAGLLHGTGSYALGVMIPDEYRRIDPRLVGEDRLRTEEQAFGIGHAEAGALLLQSWNTPEILCEALRHYVHPEKAADYRDIATILFVAARLASPEGELNVKGMADCTEALKFLLIKPEAAAKMLENISIGASGG